MAISERHGSAELGIVSAAASYQAHESPLLMLSDERNNLIISYVQVSAGVSVPLSRYGDPIWNYAPYLPHAARGKNDKQIVWEKTPVEWIPYVKSAVAAFTFRAPPGGEQLDPGTIPKRTVTLNAFVKWCSASGIAKFSDVSSFDLSRYIQKIRDDGGYDRTLAGHLAVLRKVYDLRAAMLDSFTDEAAAVLRSDLVGPLWEPAADNDRRTKLIPLAEASRLFTAARAHLADAARLLRLRDNLIEQWRLAAGHVSRIRWGATVKRPAILAAGFQTAHQFETAITDIRTAGYIVLAMTTGCRVHELGEAQVGCVYSESVDGATYWWLRAATRKIGDGPTRWLAPEVAKEAADVLEWYSAPFRQAIAKELSSARQRLTCATSALARGQLAAQILEFGRNVDRLFLSEGPTGTIASTSTASHNKQLRSFAERNDIELESPLATHRFRRTYAVILVHLNKGPRIDLITLQHHFKHASVVMTEWYAELTETDRELYELIEMETDYFDLALVDHWLDSPTPLAGGFGARIKAYAGKYHQPIFFKTRRDFVDSIRDGINIRSTGHSWCLSGAEDCGGKGLFEPPTCGSCLNGVIDDTFADVWQNLRQDHQDLLGLEDIGPGGRAKAMKGLAVAEAILAKLAPLDVGTSDV